jgi:predicted HicB family RNase H-like nuclease
MTSADIPYIDYILPFMMKYKGYTAVAELDTDAGVIFGRVIGLRDVITFQGTTVEEAVKAFHDSIDVYLEFCANRGEEAEKPYSGQFVLRIDPALHRAIALAAEAEGTSLNTLIESNLWEAFCPDATKSTIAAKRKKPTKTSKVFGRTSYAPGVFSTAKRLPASKKSTILSGKSKKP